ncbi:putative multidrug resistance ABC transporter ATP-binding/permease protein YheH [Peribacillus sp. Bi96]|uniref:ABC transporter ATP-binding protein n=1 Tax=Peribacillus sp. Bi96 TaxID=2884273 RepID=UPI001D9849DD|nr:ABC transporter ATP-binding protein [Peribacillus sp. Bi96]CAH0220664.1 putative multidrug resistance ABC transporter ATP-binding/permease protein YheH [Peribacillus sp. Bi96]
MKVVKKLFDYAALYKKLIIGALIMLTLSVAADLTGPFVAKKIIDSHILGIESSWYESEKGKDAVKYDENWYKRADYFTEGEKKGREVHVLQVGNQFVFLNEGIPMDGRRTLENQTLIIKKDGKEQRAQVEKLTSQEVMGFYQPEIPRILKLVAFYFGLVIISSIFQYGQSFYLQKAANRIIQRMRNDIFTHISRLPIRYFDNMPAGKVVARVTNDTEAIRELYVTVLANFFSSTINIFGVLIALYILDARAGTMGLLLIPIIVIWTKVYRKFASKYNHIIRERVSDINGMINESISGMNIIQAFGREKETKQSFESLNREHYSYQNKMLHLNSLTGGNLIGVIKVLALIAFVWYFGGISLTASSAISLGMMYAIVDLISRLLHPLHGIVNQFANLEQALVAGERAFSLLDEQGLAVSDENISRYKGNVQFDHVSFGYKDNEYVLKDISFSAKQGETVALVGHTGSGKSSIMNLLFRFYDSSEGQIKIDGRDILDIPHQTLREHMGIVLQDPYLFTGTIASNISLNHKGITREMVEKALKDVGGDKVLKHLPLGLDEPVIEKGGTLSSGQRQLISFARALAFNPAILILDEATASIDTETEAIIQEGMEVLKKGRTTFIIAHRLSTIKNADQILVLDKGRITEKGTHEELMGLKGKYYQMYELQAGPHKGMAG